MQRATTNTWLPWRCYHSSKKEEWLGLTYLYLVKWYWKKSYSIGIEYVYLIFFFLYSSFLHKVLTTETQEKLFH